MKFCSILFGLFIYVYIFWRQIFHEWYIYCSFLSFIEGLIALHTRFSADVKLCPIISRYRKRKVCKYKSLIWLWTLDVSRTASYEITLVRLSVRPSVRPSLSFLKIGLLLFSDIVHDDSWPWYLATDGAKFLRKKIWRPEFGSETRFFAIFSSLVH